VAGDIVDQVLQSTADHHGYAVVLGIDDPALLDSLVKMTVLQVFAIDPDVEKIETLRHKYTAAGLYGSRIALHAGGPGQLDLPPYMASLAVFGDASWTTLPGDKERSSELEVLRPYGGTACLRLSDAEHTRLAAAGVFQDWAAVERVAGMTIVRREGGLPGAANYTGDWTSAEERVRAPLGLLWFDDTLGHFKRSPQPMFVDGLMISYPKDWMARHREDRKVPYDLLPPVLSDVYTGRVLSDEERSKRLPDLPSRNLTAQPNQYRPPYQADDWKPEKPAAGNRINPLTGEKEPRSFPKSYGCDGGVDYGPLYTMRSGTAAFYDKRVESGTCYISGPRSGCTNSVIPACGLLNVPYFYEGCTCSYPLPCGLALVSMPPEHEQWAAWGEGMAESIRRVGINFGAPGDRMTREGTLWLDYPSRGGPSPEVQVEVEPASAEFYYHHSLWIEGGSGWPWVAASGVAGASSITISGLRPRTFTVRLYFADPENGEPQERLFDIVLNGRTAANDFDIVATAGGGMRGAVGQFEKIRVNGSLEIGLKSRKGRTLLSGIELISR
jgi:hypothetical protein